MEKRGFSFEEYDAEELSRKLHMKTDFVDEEAQLLNLRQVYKGVLAKKAGTIDADCLVRFYEEEFLKMGGKIEYGVEANGLIVKPRVSLGVPGEPYFWQEARVAGIRTNKGSITAEKVILAAGAWIPQLLDDVGIECYIKPKKRQVFPIEAKTQELKELLFVKGFNNEGCIPFHSY